MKGRSAIIYHVTGFYCTATTGLDRWQPPGNGKTNTTHIVDRCMCCQRSLRSHLDQELKTVSLEMQSLSHTSQVSPSCPKQQKQQRQIYTIDFVKMKNCIISEFYIHIDRLLIYDIYIYIKTSIHIYLF